MAAGKTCLGIESTAHTFGVGIVNETGNILSDDRIMYRPERGKGILPREAGEHHMKNAATIIKNSLDKAGLQIGDIDVIAYSQGPGLPPCLNVGAAVARYLSLSNKIPLIGANHPIGHIEIGKVTTHAKDPVVLYMSGGNTQVIAFTEGRYRVFGETQDVAIGNAFDNVARSLNLKSPGGPEIERLAKEGNYVNIPYVVKGMDISFSGIVTDIQRQIKAGVKAEDICHSLQETAFAMMIEVTERALAHTGKNEVLLVGGVAANKRLQEMLDIMCKERDAKMYVVDLKYSGDNGSMIAWAGMLDYMSGQITTLNTSQINPKWKTDQVDIAWM